MRQHDFGDIASRLVRRAARHASPRLAARLEEEWLADLSARCGVASRMRFALGCCWAGLIITREHGAACATASGAAPGQLVLLLHGHFDPSRWSRGTVALIGIVCVHAALIYAFATGLAQRVVAFIPTSLEFSNIAEPQAREQPPALPPPRFVRPGVESTVEPLTVVVADGPATIHVVPAPQHPTLPAQPATSPVASRIPGGPGTGFPDTDDFYPPIARRLGEAGTTVVEVCVDQKGGLTAVPAIVQSSGRSRIDRGALDLARAGSGHYRPTTENGRPVSACYAFRVTFKLRD